MNNNTPHDARVALFGLLFAIWAAGPVLAQTAPSADAVKRAADAAKRIQSQIESMQTQLGSIQNIEMPTTIRPQVEALKKQFLEAPKSGPQEVSYALAILAKGKSVVLKGLQPVREIQGQIPQVRQSMQSLLRTTPAPVMDKLKAEWDKMKADLDKCKTMADSLTAELQPMEQWFVQAEEKCGNDKSG